MKRVQRGIRRAFVAYPDHEFTTRELLEWTHPRARGWRRPRKGNPLPARARDRDNHCRAIRRACDQLAVRVGRRWPDGVVWRLKTDDK
jgi:hypothetical protein